MDLALIAVGSGIAFLGSRLRHGQDDRPTWGAVLLALGVALAIIGAVIFVVAFVPAFIDGFNQGYQDGG